MLLIALIIAFIALLVATITDLKSREVPDYVSYGLIFIAFTISLLYTIAYKDYSYIMQSVLGFTLGVAIAYAMFYLGQWGGGDSKLIMGLGAVIGFNVFPIFGKNNFWLLILILNIIFIGAIYGLLWSIFLAIKNRKIFLKSLKSWLEKREVIIVKWILLIVIVLLTILILTAMSDRYMLLMLLFVCMLYMIFYLWIIVKVIEETCMIKQIPINKLTEGDWIYKDVKIGKKYLAGPKDLGISREQIELLKKYAAKGKIKMITIKEGIPFIPAFLLAFIVTIICYYTSVLSFLF